jgi:sugar phosphate isomerase/epimerase
MRNPFSISTSWNSARHTTAAGIIEEIISAGFDSAELGFSLPRHIVDGIISFKDKGVIKISGLHNICPLPDDIEPSRASPDYYSLASLDAQERERARDAALNTIRYAKISGAGVVILHAGRVDMKDRTRDLAALINEPSEFESLKAEMAEERRLKNPPHIESVMNSLRELIPAAEDAGVKLAVETRYYHREIPSIEEFKEIFSVFRPGTLFYWHDTGHAEVFERLSFGRHKDFLELFSNRLIGVHLHDIIGPIDDHKPPSYGMFDFRMLKPYLKADTIKVIEAHQPASVDQLIRSVKYLTGVLG